MTAPARSLLADLRVAFDDADAVTLDMLRPLRRRNLGPAEHQRLYREARDKLTRILAELGGEGGPGGE